MAEVEDMPAGTLLKTDGDEEVLLGTPLPPQYADAAALAADIVRRAKNLPHPPEVGLRAVCSALGALVGNLSQDEEGLQEIMLFCAQIVSEGALVNLQMHADTKQ